MVQAVPLIVAAFAFALTVRWIYLGGKVGFGWSAAHDPEKDKVIRKICLEFLIFVIFLSPLLISGYL